MEEEISMEILANRYEKSASTGFSTFEKAFWGDKNNGFDVLFQNLRNSQTTVKELEFFLRECANSEDQYVKSLGRVSVQIKKFLMDTSFSPVWNQVLKELNERNSWAHLHFMHRLNELIREVQSYHEDLKRKKRLFRDSEQSTQQSVETFKNAKLQLTKTSALYKFLSDDFKKQSKLLDYNQNHSPSSTPVQHLTLNLQKLEKKCFQSQEDYRQAIEKYNQALIDYDKRFTESCHVFEAQEKAHLRQMRIFIMSYTQLVAQLNSTRQKNFNDSQQKLNNVYTNETLLEQLILTKSTGLERPGKAEFQNPSLIKGVSSYLESTNSEAPHDLTTSRFNKKPILTGEFQQASKTVSEYSNIDQMVNSTQTIDSIQKDVKKNESKLFGLFNFKKSKKDQTDFKLTHSKQSSVDNSKELDLDLKIENLSSGFEISEKSPNHKNYTEESKYYVGSFITKADQLDSFSTSVFNQTSLSEMMSSINSKLTESNCIPIKNIEEKSTVTDLKFNVAGSLITATSLDNNNNFLGKSSENKSSPNFLDPSQEEDEFFAQFDDINFESINQMNLISNGNKEVKKNHLANTEDDGMIFDSKESNEKNDLDCEFGCESIKEEYPIEIDDDLTNNSDTDSDSDCDSDSETPKKVILRIKPIDEVNRSVAASPDVLMQISKSLQLKFNKNNNYSRKNKPYTNVYSSSTSHGVSGVLSKSIADESFTSMASSNQNLQNSTSPSLQSPSPWCESRSASAVEFDPSLDIDSRLIQAKLDLFHENSSTMFEDIVKPSKAPPLPPLPINIQQKYQKKLSNHKISDTLLHIKSDPILINSTVKFPSSSIAKNNDKIEENSVSVFGLNANTESFNSVASSGKNFVKF